MQLILNTGATVEINEKMSLSEDKLEKGTLDVQSAVTNGNIANGDIPNEDTGADDTNKKLEHIKEDEANTTEVELKRLKSDDISSKAGIESLHENESELNQAANIVNGKDDSTNNESVIETSKNDAGNNISETEINDANTIADVSESEQLEKEQNDIVSNNMVTSLDHKSSTDIIEENNDILEINTTAELDNEGMTLSSIVDAKECLTAQKEDAVSINKDIEFKDEPGTVNSISDDTADNIADDTVDNTADATVDNIADAPADSVADAAMDSIADATVDKITPTVDNIADATVDSIADTAEKKENNDVDFDTKAEIETENENTNIHAVENSISTGEVKNNEDEIKKITIGHEDNDPPNIAEKELSPVSSHIEEIDTVSIPIKNNKSAEHTEDVDMMPEIENTINSKNDEEKKDCVENVTPATSDMDAMKEHILNAETIIETNKSEVPVSVPDEKVKMETEETDTSDENIDLIDINNKKESEDVMECVKKELEDNETSKTAKNDTPTELDLMDVDESAQNAQVNLEVNPETSEESLSNKNENSNNTFSEDRKTNEPILEKNETANVGLDSSDEVIFNLDDDREQENELVKPKESESTEVIEDDSKLVSGSDDDKKISDSAVSKQSNEIIDLDENVPKNKEAVEARRENVTEKNAEAPKITPVLKLSNTLDILSDDEDEPKETAVNNKCINIEDDDDVMLIDEDTDGNETKTEPAKETEKENQAELKPKSPDVDTELNKESTKGEIEPTTKTEVPVPEQEVIESTPAPNISEKVRELSPEIDNAKPLLHEKFLKACKKNLSDMTREELEEFCILKIVESVIDRSSLSEVKAKLKTLTQNIDEYNKKAKMLTKQNRDLQVVLKSVQEDQKKGVDNIVPLKITRSVGMQVLMTDKVAQRNRKGIGLPAPAPANKQLRNPVVQSPRPPKPQTPQIPVPRLVPANNPTLKSPSAPQPATLKIGSPLPNGIKNPSPVQKAEKRTHNRIQSVTVDLTDDEPPAKVVNRAQTPVVPPVRLVPAQNLLAPPRPSTVNSPRKVYIPISGPQGQNVRPGQTIMLKTVPNPGPRQRCPPPHMVRMPQAVRMQRPQAMRHPAPLPDCMKQYQPPNWKALPPAPDLKLAKVENGIVISWKIEGYQEDSYEEIASYQLYAYQETASPPNTALWKKIGDVKALPLPMACTLTQFMAGYKYYFAVRAVDIRSRLGPFSLPGSILLLNKM